MKILYSLLIAVLVTCTALPAWAISYVGGQVASTVGTTSAQTVTFTSLTGGSDTAPAVGDLVVVTWCTGSDTDRSLTIANTGATNYTLLGSELYANDTYDTNMRVAYRVMPDPVETQVVLSSSGGGTGSTSDAGSATIQVFRDVHATPLEQAVQQGTATDTSLVNPGPITPTTTGTFIYVAGCGASNVAGSYTSSDITAFRTTSNIDLFDSMVGSGYLAWTSGAFDPAAFGGGGTDSVNNSYAWTVAAFAPQAEAASSGGNTCGALFLLGVGGC